MMHEPKVTREIHPANKFMWVVRTYLDLITNNVNLVAGEGLKTLYTLSNGCDTLNDDGIRMITEKADRMGLIPNTLSGFMVSSILKNCKLYANELVSLINDRILAISNGDAVNPSPTLKYSPAMARREYYVPTIGFMKRAQRAIVQDTWGSQFDKSRPAAVTINDVATDASMLLHQLEMTEGHDYPDQTSFGALAKLAMDLNELIDSEAYYATKNQDYKPRVVGALTILWVIGKLLYGDLGARPLLKDINLTNLDNKITMTDGTLASIPFPIQQTMGVFNETSATGTSLKGSMYLAAVSGAAFYSNAGNKIYEG
jgi:hypothetical protein